MLIIGKLKEKSYQQLKECLVNMTPSNASLPPHFKKALCLNMANKIHNHYVHEASHELTCLHKKNLQFMLKSPSSPQKYKTVELNQMQLQSSPEAKLLWGFPIENMKRAESSEGRKISHPSQLQHT